MARLIKNFKSPVIVYFQLLEEKGIEWARRNEDLQRELRHALTSSIYDTEREASSVNTLQQVNGIDRFTDIKMSVFFTETVKLS